MAREQSFCNLLQILAAKVSCSRALHAASALLAAGRDTCCLCPAAYQPFLKQKNSMRLQQRCTYAFLHCPPHQCTCRRTSRGSQQETLKPATDLPVHNYMGPTVSSLVLNAFCLQVSRADHPSNRQPESKHCQKHGEACTALLSALKLEDSRLQVNEAEGSSQ